MRDVKKQAMLNTTTQPDITFFGEDLPKTFHDRLVEHDRNLVDLVLIIGTSLKVAPVSEIPSFLPPGIPQLYISREVSFPLLSPSPLPLSSSPFSHLLVLNTNRGNSNMTALLPRRFRREPPRRLRHRRYRALPTRWLGPAARDDPSSAKDRCPIARRPNLPIFVQSRTFLTPERVFPGY